MSKEKCRTCGGSGEILEQVNFMPLFMFGMPFKRNYRKCESCNGTGEKNEKSNN